MASAPDGSLYLTGYTVGSLWGPNAGETDAYLLKLSGSGTTIWAQQFGTSLSDTAASVAVDSSNNVYVSGVTRGVMGPGSLNDENAFANDVYVRKFNPAGTAIWTRQTGGNIAEVTSGVAVSPSGAVVESGTTLRARAGANNGGTNNAALRGYAPNGTLLWENIDGDAGSERAVGVAYDRSSPSDIPSAVEAIDGAGVITVNKIAMADGSYAWSRNLSKATQSDAATAIAVDGSGNSYVTGYTLGNLGGNNIGGQDAFVAKYDNLGALVWVKQFGTDSTDGVQAITVDANGNTFVAGTTSGNFGVASGAYDAFVCSLDSSGNLLWAGQYGSGTDDGATALAIGANRSLYIGGQTSGAFFSANAGDTDGFIFAIAVPEPSTFGLLSAVMLTMLRSRRRAF